MNPEKREVGAFKETLETSKFDKQEFLKLPPKLAEFVSDKRFIVRLAHPYMFEEGQYTTAEEIAKKVKGLYEELKEKYGIEAPVQFVVAMMRTAKRLFTR